MPSVLVLISDEGRCHEKVYVHCDWSDKTILEHYNAIYPPEDQFGEPSGTQWTYLRRYRPPPVRLSDQDICDVAHEMTENEDDYEIFKKGMEKARFVMAGSPHWPNAAELR